MPHTPPQLGTGSAFKTTGVTENLGLLSPEKEAYAAELRAKQAQAVQHARELIFYGFPVEVTPMDTPVYGRVRAYIAVDQRE